MKINNLKINGFANLENKDIQFSNGINLILGNNEKGKSSLLKFIPAMFYGLSKNKLDKDVTEIEKFKPWFAKEFSGKIEYTLDNNDKYSIFRDFENRHFQVLDKNSEDITNQFSIDKAHGTNCFYEQTGIDENLFLDTNIIEQDKTKLDEKSQSQLIQKITNLISTGKNNISYKKAMDKLNQKLIEDIGSDRTTGRPINILDEKIKDLENEKARLSSSLNQKSQLETRLEKMKKNIENEDNKLKFLKLTKIHIEKNLSENEKIKTNKELQRDYAEKINNLEERSKKKAIERENTKVEALKYIFFFLLILAVLGASFYLKSMNILFLVLPMIIISLLIFSFDSSKANKKKQTITSDLNAIEFQIGEYKNNILKLEETNKKILEELENDEKSDLETFKKYFYNLNSIELQTYFNLSIEDINNRISNQENELIKAKIDLQTASSKIDELDTLLERLGMLDLKLENLEKEKQQLFNLQDSIFIAKEALEEAYKKAKENIIPQMQEKLKICANKLIEKNYNIYFREDSGLQIEIENGKIVPISFLSTGTIDQIYLSLRLNVLSNIVEEKIPFIFDEPFAFYDDKRIENTIKYLINQYPNRQIIFFSCSNREYEILNKLGINFNLITL